eukprot:2111549-Rhodomonas_salina.2
MERHFPRIVGIPATDLVVVVRCHTSGCSTYPGTGYYRVPRYYCWSDTRVQRTLQKLMERHSLSVPHIILQVHTAGTTEYNEFAKTEMTTA